MIDESNVAYVDIETTGLDPDVHEIWEVGLIVDNVEWNWGLPVDLGRADAAALRIGRFHERNGRVEEPEVWRSSSHYPPEPTTWGSFARNVAALTRGRHLVGAVVSFDEERLRKLLRANGACPEWSHRLICVETLTAGHLGLPVPIGLGKSALALEIPVVEDEAHTALGDARLARQVYLKVMGA